MTLGHHTQSSDQTVVQAVWVGSVGTFATWSRPSIFKLQFFVLQRSESDEFGSVYFMWIFLLIILMYWLLLEQISH